MLHVISLYIIKITQFQRLFHSNLNEALDLQYHPRSVPWRDCWGQYTTQAALDVCRGTSSKGPKFSLTHTRSTPRLGSPLLRGCSERWTLMLYFLLYESTANYKTGPTRIWKGGLSQGEGPEDLDFYHSRKGTTILVFPPSPPKCRHNHLDLLQNPQFSPSECQKHFASMVFLHGFRVFLPLPRYETVGVHSGVPPDLVLPSDGKQVRGTWSMGMILQHPLMLVEFLILLVNSLCLSCWSNSPLRRSW